MLYRTRIKRGDTFSLRGKEVTVTEVGVMGASKKPVVVYHLPHNPAPHVAHERIFRDQASISRSRRLTH